MADSVYVYCTYGLSVLGCHCNVFSSKMFCVLFTDAKSSTIASQNNYMHIICQYVR